MKLILRGKRFGFSLEEIRQLLNMYDIGDAQVTQIQETYRIAQARLADLERKRVELDEAIDELKGQLVWGQSLLEKRVQETVRTQM